MLQPRRHRPIAESASGQFTRVNGRPVRLVGYTPSELLRRRLPLADPPDEILASSWTLVERGLRGELETYASKSVTSERLLAISCAHSRQHRPGRAARPPFFFGGSDAGRSGQTQTEESARWLAALVKTVQRLDHGRRRPASSKLERRRAAAVRGYPPAGYDWSPQRRADSRRVAWTTSRRSSVASSISSIRFASKQTLVRKRYAVELAFTVIARASGQATRSAGPSCSRT